MELPDGSPPPQQSSTRWSLQIRDGDSDAARQLWDLYFQRMVSLARKQLRGTRLSVRDEEDIALSAFKSFCLGVRAGKYDAEDSSTNLWPLLVSITLHKAVDQIRHVNRKKRSVDNESSNESNRTIFEMEDLVSSQPSPEQIADASESFQNLLELLDATGDTQLRQIAIEGLEGNLPNQIAVTLGCSTRTIQRKLQTIKALWDASRS